MDVLDRHDVPTWEILVPYAFGVFAAGVGAYAKGLSSRVKSLEKEMLLKKADSDHQIADLKERMLTQYHDAQEIDRIVRSALEPFKLQFEYIHKELTKVDALHARLDRWNVPRAPYDK